RGQAGHATRGSRTGRGRRRRLPRRCDLVHLPGREDRIPSALRGRRAAVRPPQRRRRRRNSGGLGRRRARRRERRDGAAGSCPMKACWLLAALCCCAVAAFAQAPRESHGSHDAYAAPGVALAWGVLRGSDEASTAVIVRIDVDPGAYPWLSMVAIDPFSKQEQAVQRPVQQAGPFDLRIPRMQFADYPRTELRLFDSAAHAQANAPQLVVYYL